ncbi:histone deacetylase [candidate division CSSED10-310 bacterium]|uniref:Histone deacetylase n=1 Tax=candidate division CSSED10-310 bacterium TaxID=2855610 RepID=A0ABV6YYK1_UNCC1
MKTGIVYDEVFTKHAYSGHPENFDRLVAIRTLLTEKEILNLTTPVSARTATDEELELCHHSHYISQVKALSLRGGGMLDPDTYMNEYSCEAASKAVGGMIDLTTKILTGELNNGFALTRPPGHHATPNRGMGFCIFNTVAVAASALQTYHDCARVVIVDFDVHHGNGTQDILEDNASIMYISSHQFPHYPGTGNFNAIGSKNAQGTKINIPLPHGTGDSGLKLAYSEIVFPVIKRFSPDFILISAGYDGHWQDYLAGLNFSLSGYHWLVTELINLADECCQGRIAFCLEGGYHRKVLANGVVNAFWSLLGQSDQVDDPIGSFQGHETDITAVVDKLKTIHNL